jgi:hypothetical protein
MSCFRAQLDPDSEVVAIDLARACGNLSMPNARWMVVEFGAPKVMGALAVLGVQPPGEIRNPAGYVRSMLRRGAVDPERDTEVLAQRIAAQFADGRLSRDPKDFIQA